MKLRIGLLLLLMLFVTQAFGAEPRVSVTQGPGEVTVYVHDLDVLRAKHAALAAEVRVDDAASHEIELDAPWQTPAVIIRAETAAKSVVVSLRDGDAVLFEATIDAGKVIEPVSGVKLTKTMAAIEEGGAQQKAPAIAQPDLSKALPAKLRPATKRIDLARIEARVVSDRNVPLVSAQNSCRISRQTAHPDDPTRRSVYVPMKSQVYDEKTGEPTSNVHYLVEVPIDPAWLEGSDDRVITLDPKAIRIHTCDARWPNANGTPVSGNGLGGLGQGSGTTAVDDDGNLYFSSSVPCHVSRFNIAKAKWEAPPIDIMKVIEPMLPNRAAMPTALRGKRPVMDSSLMVNCIEGRLFVIGLRYATYNDRMYMNGVVSFPLEHWDNPAKFYAGAKLVACSWPGTPVSLYDHWPAEGDPARKLGGVGLAGDKLYIMPYISDERGPWRVALDAKGAGIAAEKVPQFEVNEALGGYNPKLTDTAIGTFGFYDYGILTAPRELVRQALQGAPDKTPKGMLAAAFGDGGDATPTARGELTIYYDPLAAMNTDPKRYAEILDNQEGPSLGPCYMVRAIPDKPGHVLSVGEYGYYLADIDLTTAATGKVHKRYLSLDLGEVQNDYPVKVGLGPYGSVWWREGATRSLAVIGYSGVATLRYSENGTPLERFDSVKHTLHEIQLDYGKNGRLMHQRYPQLGLGGHLYFTGEAPIDRGGNAFSTGLAVVTLPAPTEMRRLSQMSRASTTGHLNRRLVYEADGRRREQFFLDGEQCEENRLALLRDFDRPTNSDAKVFVYEAIEAENPTDLFGFSMPVISGESRVLDMAISPDRRYLITVQHGCLVTFDLATWQYADAARVPGEYWPVRRPTHILHTAPDDRIYVGLSAPDSNEVTFFVLDISPKGEINFQPHLTLRARQAADFEPLRGGVIDFVADPSGDGSYDLCMGRSFRSPGTTLWVIPDFIAARP